MRRYKINPQHVKLMRLLASGEHSQRDAARLLGVSKSAVNQMVKRLIDHGYLLKRRKGIVVDFALKPLAIKALAEAGAQNLNSAGLFYRIHNFWLTFPLKDPIAKNATQLLLSRNVGYRSSRVLQNHTDTYLSVEDTGAWLSSSSISIRIPDIDNIPLGADLKSVVLERQEKVERLVVKLEEMLGIRVKRISKGVLLATVSNLEVAIKNHPFAKAMNDKGPRGKKPLVYEEGVLKLIVDKSHGIDELESVHPGTALDDAQSIGDFCSAVMTGKFDYEKLQKDMEKVKEVLKGLGFLFLSMPTLPYNWLEQP
jgi:DNA-binding Lrp family transcriptional regulator